MKKTIKNKIANIVIWIAIFSGIIAAITGIILLSAF
jgi:cytochrome b subunit of formate dehydrogenase